MSSSSDNCSKEGCCRDTGDSGQWCLCGRFWCSHHTSYIIGPKCVGCNKSPKTEREIFKECYGEVCSYGVQCSCDDPTEVGRPKDDHDESLLTDGSLGRALKMCWAINGIECLENHEHDRLFQSSLAFKSMSLWMAAKNAIDDLNDY